MTAAIYDYPMSRALHAARAVARDPQMHTADVVDTATVVLDWMGTDQDRAMMHRLPKPDMVTGRIDAQLAEARRVAAWAGHGEAVSLPALMTAQDVLETHGVASDTAALVQIEAAAMLQRIAARKTAPPPYSKGTGTIRAVMLCGMVTVGLTWLALVAWLA